MQVNTVGPDLAKDVFQVHGVSVTGDKAFNKKIKRKKLLEFFENLPPCVVGMEACGSSPLTTAFIYADQNWRTRANDAIGTNFELRKINRAPPV